MLYLIGLGLSLKSLSIEAIESIKKCKKVYLEAYTADIPYTVKELESITKKQIILKSRQEIENENIVSESKNSNIALLVYGSPLTATTHISLIIKARKEKVKLKVIHNASIFDAVSESGLQLYKFGKTASLPAWSNNYKPTSFIETIKENKKINAHTLVLVDIGLEYQKALSQLEEAYPIINAQKIVVCEKLGTEKPKIFYGKTDALKKHNISKLFCFIIPAKLHFIEEEALNFLKP